MTNHPYDKDYFNAGTISNYRGYEDDIRFKLWADEIQFAFKPKNVLDIGCAKGFMVLQMRKLGIDAYGTDISEYAIESAPDLVKKYITVANILDDDFEKKVKVLFKEKFDLITSHDVMEHLPEDKIEVVISKLCRLGIRQYHVITCQEYDFGGDRTHITVRPESWWIDKFPKNENTVVRRACEIETPLLKNA